MRKTVLITGGTDGIGKATAASLAALGFEVILTGRSPGRCEEAKTQIIKATGNDKVRSLCVDFSEVEQIKKAADFLTCYIHKIDVLINNAGTFENEFHLVEGRFERTFFVNHLAHFMFDKAVFELMKGVPDARVIIVSSMAHSSSMPEPFELLHRRENFNPYSAYSHSKLANILYAFKLARLFKDSGITSNCLHPGVINTKLLRAGWGAGGGKVEYGAATSVYLATSDEVKGINGKYFVNKKISYPAAVAFDNSLQDRLWDYGEEILLSL